MKITLSLAVGIGLMALPSCFQAATNTNPVTDIVKSHGGNAVVMFSKTGCPFCDYLKPIFTRVGQGYQGKLYFHTLTVNPGNQDMLKQNYGFSTFPTVIYFKNNKQAYQHGSDNRTYTEGKIKGHIQDIYGI